MWHGLLDNQAGQQALVRLVGPTRAEVFVSNGGRNSIHRAALGDYVIYVRYGNPGITGKLGRRIQLFGSSGSP